jgi:DNA-binding NarL/FixJ family response regulator
MYSWTISPEIKNLIILFSWMDFMPNSALPLSNKCPGPVVLIVDDSQPMRQALCDLMALSYPSSCILEAGSAEQALEMVATRAPDLVLMDIALPGMDGLTCLVEIRRIWPQIRSVVISYHEEQPYRQKALDAGADAYVVKRKLYLDLMPVIQKLLKEKMAIENG